MKAVFNKTEEVTGDSSFDLSQNKLDSVDIATAIPPGNPLVVGAAGVPVLQAETVKVQYSRHQSYRDSPEHMSGGYPNIFEA